MIKIEHIETYGWEAAIRGARNPLNSWSKSDSKAYWDGDEWDYDVGDRDLNLMQNLVKTGTDHSKFMRMIGISMDITAPLYWWSEFDTYKVGTVANSCSKMHKLLAKPFEMNDFSFDNSPATKMKSNSSNRKSMKQKNSGKTLTHSILLATAEESKTGGTGEFSLGASIMTDTSL